MKRPYPPDIYRLGFLSFFNDVTADLITPLLPVYLGSLGLGVRFLGVMEGLADSLSNFVMLLSGAAADRSGRLRTGVRIGYRLAALARPLLAVPLAPVILLGRLLDRTGKGIRTPPRDRLITVSIARAEWGGAFSVQRAMDHAGALVGAPLAAVLLILYDINLPLLFLAACIPSLLSAFLIPRHLADLRLSPQPSAGLLPWRALTPTLRRYAVVIFLAALSSPSELLFLMRMQEAGAAPYAMPLAWFLFTSSALVGAYVGGPVSDTWGRRRTMAAGWLLFSLVTVAFGLTTSPAWFWPLISLLGFQAGLTEAPERAYAARIAPPEAQAGAMGVYYFAEGMGLLPASILFGLLWDRFGPAVPFFVAGGTALLATSLLSLLPSDRAKARRT
ncbi:MAG: MFS transporter [Nitrospirae bacterium]|nr:MFS transporter [Nitrospirota bacterium]